MTNNEIMTQTIAAEIAAKHIQKNQLAENLHIADSNLGRRLRNEVPWTLHELDIVATTLGLTFWELIQLAEARSKRTY